MFQLLSTITLKFGICLYNVKNYAQQCIENINKNIFNNFLMAAPRRTRTRIRKCTYASQVDIIINYQDTLTKGRFCYLRQLIGVIKKMHLGEMLENKMHFRVFIEFLKCSIIYVHFQVVIMLWCLIVSKQKSIMCKSFLFSRNSSRIIQ